MFKPIATASVMALICASVLTGCGSGTPKSGTMNTQPASDGCAAMDKVYVSALKESSTGKIFSSLPKDASPEVKQVSWQAFTVTLNTDYRAKFTKAAAKDKTAQAALGALGTYATLSAQISDGKLSEFADPTQAEADLKIGRTPTPNPTYVQAVNQLAEAGATLAKCMPHWPVAF